MIIHASEGRQPRHDGWTPERQTRFLDGLADKGNVRHACSLAGLSQQSAYVFRRRDPGFARAWAAALALARERCAQVLAERAIDGVEEPVWYRGEQVGTRRKYDSRLLLAHIARLDKLADDETASADAGRFDELLACLAGESVPAVVASDCELLPLDRESAGLRAGNEADDAVRYAEPAETREASQEDGPDYEEDDAEQVELDEAAHDALEEACIAAYRSGRAEGERGWDGWFAEACTFVDRASGRLDEPPAPGLPGGARLADGADALSPDLLEKLAAVAADTVRVSSSRTHSTYSTSALARALAGPARRFDFTPRSPLEKRSSPCSRSGNGEGDRRPKRGGGGVSGQAITLPSAASRRLPPPHLS
jgi:hypothetical protein